jgi:hypothetical protein
VGTTTKTGAGEVIATILDRDRLDRIKADFAGPGVCDEDIYWLIQLLSPSKPAHRWWRKPGEAVYTLLPTPGCVVTVEPYGGRLWRWSVVSGDGVLARGTDVRIRHNAEQIAEAAYTSILWAAR